MTAERYVLDHVVPYAVEKFGAASPRLALLGTSMGGQGALRFAYKHPRTFPIVAALAPAIDYQQRFYDEGEETLPQMYPDAEAVRQDTATLHVHPLNWPRNQWFCCDPADRRWHDSAQKLKMKLSALGIPHEGDLGDYCRRVTVGSITITRPPAAAFNVHCPAAGAGTEIAAWCEGQYCAFHSPNTQGPSCRNRRCGVAAPEH